MADFEEEIEEIEEPEPPEVLPPAKTTWLEIGIVILLAVVPNAFAAIVAQYARPSSFWYQQGAVAFHSMAIGSVVLYLMFRSGLSWRHYGLARNRDLTGYGIFVAGIITGSFLMPYVASMARPFFASDMAHPWYRPAMPHGAVQWGFLVFALVLNSISEEVAMRGFLTARFYDVTKSIPLSVLLPGFLFGIYHCYQGWGSAVGATFLGVVFSAMFLSARRLKALIWAHTAINLATFILLAYRMY